MAVAYDNFAVGTFDTTDDTTHTNSFTVSAGSNRALLAFVGWHDAAAGSAAVSSVSSDLDGNFSAVPGSSSTAIVDGGARDMGAQWWYLVAPSTGLHTITLTMSENTQAKCLMLLSVNGVNQSTPLGTASIASVNGNNTHSVTSSVGDLVVSAYSAATNTATQVNATTGSTHGEVTEAVVWNSLGGLVSQPASAGSTGVAYTVTASENVVYSGVAIKAVPGTAALTGTVTSSITETDIVTGGKTIILTLTDDTYVTDTIPTPVIEVADCVNSGNNTASTAWVVSYPNASSGDLLLYNIIWDDSTTTTSVTKPLGPNGETFVAVVGPATDSGTTVRSEAWYYKATGTWTSGSHTVVPSASEQWTATVLRVPSGEYDSASAIGAVASYAGNAATDTFASSPTLVAGASDANGRIVAWIGVNADPVLSTPSGWSTIASVDRGAISGTLSFRETAASASETVAPARWSIAADTSANLAYIIRAPTSSAFDNAVASLIAGVDSAQSEANGWDARVKTTLTGSDIVRTSDTVVTFTLPAVAAYDITATETITATIPASMVNGAAVIVATPTFTVSAAGGGGGDERVIYRVLILGVG